MESVVFHNGIAFSVKKREGKEIRSKLDTLLLNLDCEVEFENTTTLADIWKYIKKDATQINIIFFQAMGGHDLKPFIKQFELPTEEEKYPLDAIELYWEIKIHKGIMDIFTNCHGLGMATEDMPAECQGKMQNWAIEHVPINQLKNVPVVLKRECTILQSTRSTGYKPLSEITKNWTVYDMILGLLDELSFFGSPSNQTKFVAEMDQSMAEIKDNIDQLREFNDIADQLRENGPNYNFDDLDEDDEDENED